MSLVRDQELEPYFPVWRAFADSVHEGLLVIYEIEHDGTDPEAPDWEVAELENGVVKKKEDIYDNLTYAEAQQIAGMWTKKKEDAGV